MSEEAEITSALDNQGVVLAPLERLRAVLQTDLDENMQLAGAILWLTTDRLLWRRAQGSLEEVAVDSELAVRVSERPGAFEVAITSHGTPRATFRVSNGKHRDVHAFERAIRDTSSAAPLAKASNAAPPRSTRRPLLRLLSMTLPHRGLLALGLLLTLASTAAGLVPAYVTMPLVDQVLVPSQASATPTEAWPTVFGYLAALFGSALLAWLLTWGQGAVLAVVSELVGAQLRNVAFTHLLSLDVQYFENKRSGDLVSRISAETDRICTFLSDSLVDFISDVLMIVGTCTVLFTLHPTLGLVAVGSFPIIGGVTLTLRQRMSEGFAHGGRVRARMVSLLADAISGIRVVKAFGQERHESDRFADLNERIVQVNNRSNALWTFFWPLVTFLNQMGLLVVWAFGAWLVLEGQITVGVLTAYIAYIGRLYSRVESMSRMLGATERASAAAQRLFEIIDREPLVHRLVEQVSSTRPIEGRIELQRVSFYHGTRQVLKDVSLTIKPKTLVGIVGHTGSGKSTLANLLCRFYETDHGEVRIDGMDIRRMPLESYRSQVGIVLQDPFLFYGGIGENICFGRHDASPPQIIQAARDAMAHEFILRLPNAYDTAVGERGQALSGGERQRVAIARALIMDPRILILDEATSAVDPETERKIQSALDSVAVGRTVVAIAHRLSTLRHADTIFVLNQGKLVEAGTHDKLLEQGGEYARLWAMNTANAQAQAQARAAQPDDGEAKLEKVLPEPERVALIPEPHLDLTFVGGQGLRLRDARTTAPEFDVHPKRCFPISEPDFGISLVDTVGRERAFIRTVDGLAAPAREALRLALNDAEWFPRIEQILRVGVQTTCSTWQVVTNRGPVDFVVTDEEKVRWVRDDCYALTDEHGTTYVIPTLAGLDRASRRRFRRFSA